MTRVVGIDWAASDESKCGLALGRVDGGGSITIDELLTGREAPDRKSRSVLVAWLVRFPDAIVAIDAPLGWPALLANAVAEHVAGAPLGKMADAGAFFTRATDRFVYREFEKAPLEVGADRIARTAFSALSLLEELRAATGLPLAMAFDRAERGVLEVYPAATLKVIGGAKIPPYKKPEQTVARRALVEMMSADVRLTPLQTERAIASDHVLDAVACVIAGADFAAGRAMAPPPELEAAARREGWIWIRHPQALRSPSDPRCSR